MFRFKPVLPLAIILLLGASLGLDAVFAQAPSWSQFRGPAGNGIAPSDSKPPTEWTEANFKWKTPLPGKGWSSPVYADGKIWMTSAITAPATKEEIEKKLSGDAFKSIKTVAGSVELHALCVDLASGELLKDITLGKVDSPEPINPMNSYASPTCAIAKGRVVCHFGSYGTWCLDASSGEELWTAKYEINHSVGAGSSPVIIGENAIFVCDGCDEQYIAAVNLMTGKEAWKTDRPKVDASNLEMHKAYSTAAVLDIDGQQQIVVPGAQWICGYDAGSGEEIWRFNHGRGFSITPMAELESDLIIFSTAYSKNEYVAIHPGGKGDISKSAEVWRGRNAPAMPSLIGHDGHIFGVSDRGVLICLNAETGEVLGKERRLGNVSASPLLAAGNLYLANRDGEMLIVRCSKKMEVVAKYKFESGIYASPTTVGNDLIVRTADAIIRIGK